MKLLYGDLTEKIIGAMFEVHKVLGPGFKVGLLANFGEEKLKFKRFVLNEARSG